MQKWRENAVTYKRQDITIRFRELLITVYGIGETLNGVLCSHKSYLFSGKMSSHQGTEAHGESFLFTFVKSRFREDMTVPRKNITENKSKEKLV